MELFKERRSDKDRRKTKLHAPFPLLDFKSRRIEKERRVTFDRRVEGLGLSVADAPKKRVSQTIPTIPRGSRYKKMRTRWDRKISGGRSWMINHYLDILLL